MAGTQRGSALCGQTMRRPRTIHDFNGFPGLEEGITTPDASLGGMGGCPFAPGASGNIVPEDLAFMLTAMGYDTGIYLDALMRVRAILTEALPGEPLYGFTPDAGLPLGLDQRAA
jgi:hydroxymethylglutaryl-CoA lyase